MILYKISYDIVWNLIPITVKALKEILTFTAHAEIVGYSFVSGYKHHAHIFLIGSLSRVAIGGFRLIGIPSRVEIETGIALIVAVGVDLQGTRDIKGSTLVTILRMLIEIS